MDGAPEIQLCEMRMCASDRSLLDVGTSYFQFPAHGPKNSIRQLSTLETRPFEKEPLE